MIDKTSPMKNFSNIPFSNTFSKVFMKKNPKKKKTKKVKPQSQTQRRTFSRTRWLTEEIKCILHALIESADEFIKTQTNRRRKRGFFIRISEYLKLHGYNKDKNQCKSHIQKREKEYTAFIKEIQIINKEKQLTSALRIQPSTP